MNMTNATTLPLPVKVVRECALKTLNHQRKVRDENLVEIVEQLNAAATLYNESRLTRWFNRPHKPLLDPATTIPEWKDLWVSGNMRGDHPARDTMWVSRTTWWKRLFQFTLLPVADDEKVMQVSVEDLNLFDYNHWVKEQATAT